MKRNSPVLIIVAILIAILIIFLPFNKHRLQFISLGENEIFASLVAFGRSEFDNLLNYMNQPQISCISSIAIGGLKIKHQDKKELEGDKILCTDPGTNLKKPCVVYSFGDKGNFTFEDEIHNIFRCQVYVFDPTKGLKDHLHSEDVHFYNFGISGVNEIRHFPNKKERTMMTFEAIRKKVGHKVNQTFDVVKMDIDGDEFDVLENMLDTGALKKVNHLCVRIHLNMTQDWKRVLHLLKRIHKQTYLHCFSVRKNLLAGVSPVPGYEDRSEHLVYDMSWYRY